MRKRKESPAISRARVNKETFEWWREELRSGRDTVNSTYMTVDKCDEAIRFFDAKITKLRDIEQVQQANK